MTRTLLCFEVHLLYEIAVLLSGSRSEVGFQLQHSTKIRGRFKQRTKQAKRLKIENFKVKDGDYLAALDFLINNLAPVL